ncbi:MAG: sugar transferase [Ignavibacteriaceae bacterium]|jgi:lipopolysaccharide/colanic/teichoic acid biosynthesis glycosyltransferase|nr:sugar transferase [Ignavibacteriaceae bacterium]
MEIDNSDIVIDKPIKEESGIRSRSILTKRKRSYFLRNSAVSLIIYTITFFIWYYFKRSTFLLEPEYQSLFIYYLISLFVSAIIANKAFLTREHEFSQSLRKIYISLILSLGLLTFFLLQIKAENLSRYVILGSMLTGAAAESIYFYFISYNKGIRRIIEGNPVSWKYTIPDFILLTLSIYFFIINEVGIQNINERHQIILVLIYLSWFFAALFTHKFNPLKQSTNNWAAAGLQIKFYLLIISIITLAVFTVNIKAENWSYFIESVTIYSIVSFIMFLFLYVRKLPYPTDEVTNIFLKTFELGNPAISSRKKSYDGKYRLLSSQPYESVIKQKLQFQYFKDFPKVFDFLEREIELKSFDAVKTLVIRSADRYNIDVLDNSSMELIVNLHELNDLRRINEYLRLVNEKLIKNGVYLGCVLPIKNHYKNFQKKYPFLIANLFYLIDFIWKRIFPKLPVLRKIYFYLTKGKNRAISLAETLGRLVYCGFEILDIIEIDNFVFFAVRKVREPSTDKNPSYSAIFKMRRIGKDGKKIFVYKIRTMHPYSEYLQELVYNQNKLTEGGKFKNDFRVSSWGKFLRKFWIDELPMFINFFKWEIKLVGVRPVSSHYLSLYSPKFQQRRLKYKPGLIPPFYADLPVTIEEIEASEKRYFDLYDKNPVKTDIIYLVKIVINIVFRRKRSS